MPSKKGRSRRKRGEISWTPTAFAGVHLRSYRLWWQLGVPFWVGPDKQLVVRTRAAAAGDLLAAYLDRRHPRWREDAQGDAATGGDPARSGKMTRRRRRK
jgi:hypothetical protein